MQNGKPNLDLIPLPLIIARYFIVEKTSIETLETERDAITRQMEEMDEEHAGEEGLLNEAKNNKGKITAKGVKERLKATKGDKDAIDERKVIEAYSRLMDQEAAIAKQVKDAQKALDTRVTAKYSQLSEVEIKRLVVEDKWFSVLVSSVQGELDRVSQTLTGRIKQLAERYSTPLPKLTTEVELLSARVDEHLIKMGFLWE